MTQLPNYTKTLQLENSKLSKESLLIQALLNSSENCYLTSLVSHLPDEQQELVLNRLIRKFSLNFPNKVKYLSLSWISDKDLRLRILTLIKSCQTSTVIL